MPTGAALTPPDRLVFTAFKKWRRARDREDQLVDRGDELPDVRRALARVWDRTAALEDTILGTGCTTPAALIVQAEVLRWCVDSDTDHVNFDGLIAGLRALDGRLAAG